MAVAPDLVWSSFDELLARELPLDTLLEAAAAGKEPGEGHEQLVEWGLYGTVVPEEHGGLGLGTAAIAELAGIAGGRLLPPSAVDEAFVLAPTLARLADADDESARWLTMLLEGDLRGGGAVAPPGYAPVEEDGGARLLELRSAPARLAPGASVSCLVGESWIAVVDLSAPGVSVESAAALQPGTMALHLSGTRVPSRRVLTGDDARRFLLDWHVAVLAEIGGCVRRVLAMALEHARERRQFGRAIADFQAVSHKLADIAVVGEAIDSCVARLVAAEPGASTDWLVTCFRCWIPAQARRACEDAIQVHGGMGYTWEYGLHLYYRRVLQLQAALGGGHEAALRAGREFLEGGA
jgi:alkylation response protein AidB-like acyl-CoA dehydrogenase